MWDVSRVPEPQWFEVITPLIYERCFSPREAFHRVSDTAARCEPESWLLQRNRSRGRKDPHKAHKARGAHWPCPPCFTGDAADAAPHTRSTGRVPPTPTPGTGAGAPTSARGPGSASHGARCGAATASLNSPRNSHCRPITTPWTPGAAPPLTAEAAPHHLRCAGRSPRG